MYYNTYDFAVAVRTSHTVVTIVEVINGTQVLAVIPVEDGAVTEDATQSTRRSLNLKVAVDGKTVTVPSSPTDLLHPLSGNELRVWRGAILPPGKALHTNLPQPYAAPKNSEMVPMGVFMIDDVKVKDNGKDLTMDITGYDRSKRVSLTSLTQPFVIDPGTTVPGADVSNATYITAIRKLVDPNNHFQWVVTTTSGAKPPLMTLDPSGSANRWDQAMNLALAIGCEVLFDRLGRVMLRPVADTTVEVSVATYQEGPQSVVTELDYNLQRTGVFNHVVVVSSPPNGGTAYKSEAVDNNPNSPTYWQGNFGDITFPYSSPFINSQYGADLAAVAQLRKGLGLREIITFKGVVNPALDAQDAVTVTRARLGVNSVYYLESVVTPLRAGSGDQQCTTRRRSDS